MKADAIKGLIVAAQSLHDTGVIGSGMVAHFHDLAARAALELEQAPPPAPSTLTAWDLFAAADVVGTQFPCPTDSANFADAMMAERAKRGVA